MVSFIANKVKGVISHPTIEKEQFSLQNKLSEEHVNAALNNPPTCLTSSRK